MGPAVPPTASSGSLVSEVGGDRGSPWRSGSGPQVATVVADIHPVSRLRPLPDDLDVLDSVQRSPLSRPGLRSPLCPGLVVRLWSPALHTHL